MPIHWDAKYESGEAHVDEQHKKLFAYVNELDEVIQEIKAGKPLDKQKLSDFMFHLESYVTLHFSYEEMCMGMNHCPKAKENMAAHDGLIKFYSDFQERAKEELTLEMLITLENTLVSWLDSHILGIDSNLKGCLAHHGRGGSRPLRRGQPLTPRRR